jgi:pimeloyl-ACP methyl ester carboxylesterase
VIRGEASIFFTDAMWKTWQRLRPQDNILKLDNYGHLLPLQTPELCANIIKSTINKAV